MKGELLKRLFRAIASEDQTAIQNMLSIVVEEERTKGHTLLAEQLENITHKRSRQSSSIASEQPNLSSQIFRDVIPATSSSETISKISDTHSLTLLSSKQV